MKAEDKVKQVYPKANIYGGLVLTGEPPYLSAKNKLTKIRSFKRDVSLWAAAWRRIQAEQRAAEGAR